MKFLLFLLGLSFYFIFYLFSQQKDIGWGIFSNLFLEAHLYIAISLLCIFFLHAHKFLKKEEDTEAEPKESIKLYSKDQLLFFGKIFFQNSLHFLALGLFYVSVFLIGQEIFDTIDMASIFLFWNVIVGVCILIKPRFRVFQDLLRVNTTILSLYYIVFHIALLWNFDVSSSWVDIFNIVILWILFFLSFYYKSVEHFMRGFQSYVLAFLFLEITTASFLIFGDKVYCFWILSFFFSTLFLVGTTMIRNIFWVSLSLVRIWGICFSFLFLSFFLFSILSELQLLGWFLLPLFLQSWLLYLFHRSFQNYLCLLWSIIGFCVGIYVLFDILLFPQYFFSFLVFFSFFLVFVFFFQRKYYGLDAYFYHSISLWVNIFWVIGLLFIEDFSILKLGILLAIESVYFFASSYIFRKKVKHVTYQNEA